MKNIPHINLHGVFKRFKIKMIYCYRDLLLKNVSNINFISKYFIHSTKYGISACIIQHTRKQILWEY